MVSKFQIPLLTLSKQCRSFKILRELIVRPFKIVEDHMIINLVVAPPFNLVFIKLLTFIYFPNSPACLDSPAPGTLKIQIKEKEDISLTGIACYSLNQLTLLSMAVELMFSLLILLSRLQHTSY